VKEVQRLVEAYTKYAGQPNELRKLEESTRAVFSDQSVTRNFELGDLFIECFGYDKYKDIRSAGKEKLEPGKLKQIFESGGGSVTTAAFANITQQYAYTTVIDAYALPERVFSSLIPVQPTKLQKERVPGITAMGDENLVVPENAEYPKAGVGENWIDTPLQRKRGVVVEASWEAMFYDRTGQLTDNLKTQGEQLAINIENRAIACIVDSGETAGYQYRYRWRNLAPMATYGDNSGDHSFDNLAASNTLLDWTSIQTAWLLMMAMTDPFTGQPIMLGAKDLIVPPALVAAAAFATGGNVSRAVPGYATTGNPSKTEIPNPANIFGNLQIRTSQLLRASPYGTNSDSIWFLGDISKAFKYFQSLPLEVTTAPAGNEAEFTRDCVWRVKTREVGSFVTVEPRAVIKCT
jgi:hypothetical protein